MSKDQAFYRMLVDSFGCQGNVTFSVGGPGQEEEIKAVIDILRDASPVFEIMFNSTWNEQNKVIRLPDIQPVIFRCFLLLLVTGDLKESHVRDLNLKVHDVFDILYVTKKYEVTFVHSACISFLKTETTRNFSAATLVYEYARKSDEVDLQDAVFSVIAENAANIFQRDNFLSDLSRDSLACLLKRDELVIEEVLLFQQVYKWAKVRAADGKDIEVTGVHLRFVLGDLLFFIRFPLMSLLDLAWVVRPTQILTDREFLDLLDSLVFFDSERKTKVPFGDFPRRWNQSPRSWKAEQQQQQSPEAKQKDLRPKQENVPNMAQWQVNAPVEYGNLYDDYNLDGWF